MIERIARLRSWWIVAAGAAAVLLGMVGVAVVATGGYAMFPDGYGWVAVFHILGTGAAFFWISRPFIEAYMYREFLDSWEEFKEYSNGD